MRVNRPDKFGRWRSVGEEGLEAGAEPGEVGIELDWPPVDDKQGLEDPPFAVGSRLSGHGGHCDNLARLVAESDSLKTLLIDNHDSFTYNLFQLLAEANGEEPIVVRSHEADWADLAALQFDNVVISPGPGRPEREADFGVCGEAIRRCQVPLLGVCLGHQGIGWAYGGKVAQASEAMHGRLCAVVHDGSPLFAGIPREFQAVRYHSLSLTRLPPELEPIAWSSDGVLMGIRHRARPQWGVQFHPESICTEHGCRLLANFRDLTRERTGGSNGWPRCRTASAGAPAVPTAREAERPAGLELVVERLDALVDTERAFACLYGESENSFWLDSGKLDERARFSFIGDASGPLGATIAYDVADGEVRVERAGCLELHRESIFDYLKREIRRLRQTGEELPFDLNCGFVGYFGYELKADCGASAVHGSSQPDAAFVFADRMIAFDHVDRHTYLLCLADPAGRAEAERWIAATRRRLASLPSASEPERPEPAVTPGSVRFGLARSYERYLDDIAICKRRLREGDSYEICLTNKVTGAASPDPLLLYRNLRRVNPAPFSAFLRFGETAVLSSSPERFLRIGRDRWVESKPIKGTSRRGETPAEDARLAEELRLDEKNRAENLMIADLLRNDLGMVCEVGTVHVPHLMQVETYETVHQLVSTVRGLLRAELEPPDCIRACFPAGSMTGAPKERTMEIIDELEGEARGVYSGAIGYLGLSGGCDLSVVIRTIVVDGDSTSLGAGGAIVMQSDPEEEYQEMLLKARAPMCAIDPGADPRGLGSASTPEEALGYLRARFSGRSER
jgi:para-aminobenzoate synthetase